MTTTRIHVPCATVELEDLFPQNGEEAEAKKRIYFIHHLPNHLWRLKEATLSVVTYQDAPKDRENTNSTSVDLLGTMVFQDTNDPRNVLLLDECIIADIADNAAITQKILHSYTINLDARITEAEHTQAVRRKYLELSKEYTCTQLLDSTSSMYTVNEIPIAPIPIQEVEVGTQVMFTPATETLVVQEPESSYNYYLKLKRGTVTEIYDLNNFVVINVPTEINTHGDVFDVTYCTPAMHVFSCMDILQYTV